MASFSPISSSERASDRPTSSVGPRVDSWEGPGERVGDSASRESTELVRRSKEALHVCSLCESAAFQARFRAGPTGMIVFHRSGSEPVSPRKLLIQFCNELLAAAIAAVVLRRVAAPHWLRVGIMGCLARSACSPSARSTGAGTGSPPRSSSQLADKGLGWSLAGAVMAAILPSVSVTGHKVIRVPPSTPASARPGSRPAQ
jgi:hypothetical protein